MRERLGEPAPEHDENFAWNSRPVIDFCGAVVTVEKPGFLEGVEELGDLRLVDAEVTREVGDAANAGQPLGDLLVPTELVFAEFDDAIIQSQCTATITRGNLIDTLGTQLSGKITHACHFIAEDCAVNINSPSLR